MDAAGLRPLLGKAVSGQKNNMTSLLRMCLPYLEAERWTAERSLCLATDPLLCHGQRDHMKEQASERKDPRPIVIVESPSAHLLWWKQLGNRDRGGQNVLNARGGELAPKVAWTFEPPN